jgi:hypothetical protein
MHLENVCTPYEYILSVLLIMNTAVKALQYCEQSLKLFYTPLLRHLQVSKESSVFLTMSKIAPAGFCFLQTKSLWSFLRKHNWFVTCKMVFKSLKKSFKGSLSENQLIE